MFCRYIATAHYLAGELAAPLQRKGAHLEVVTGELTPEEREERIERFAAEAEDRVPVLIATDCLSEGVNLQQHFTAVVHYDLVWNPTRHEQREGRVDRFGQAAPVVRALMLYGENNPVDGAVLRVILRKAERIRKELGVSVPMPADPNQVMQTDHADGAAAHRRHRARHAPARPRPRRDRREARAGLAERQGEGGANPITEPNHLRPTPAAARGRAAGVGEGDRRARRARRTCSASWSPPASALARRCTRRSAAGDLRPSTCLPPSRSGSPASASRSRSTWSSIGPAPSGTIHATRAHPIVTAVAEYVAELGLAEEGEIAARSAAMFTQAVATRCFVLLLRLRTQILVQHTQGDPPRHLMAEECVAVRLSRDGPAELLDDAQSRALLGAEPARNMAPEQRARMVDAGLQITQDRMDALAELARTRAEQLRADHTRVRDAAIGRSEARGYRIEVQPCLPVDVIGLYVLVPAQPGA